MTDVYDMKMHERLDEQTSMQWALFEIRYIRATCIGI